MLNRQEVRDFSERLNALEKRVDRLITLERVVGKLEEVLTSTGDSVNSLNIFMERLEERTAMKDKFSKIALTIIAASIPLLTGFSGYFITKLVDKVEGLEDNIEQQNITLTELSTKIKQINP